MRGLMRALLFYVNPANSPARFAPNNLCYGFNAFVIAASATGTISA